MISFLVKVRYLRRLLLRARLSVGLGEVPWTLQPFLPCAEVHLERWKWLKGNENIHGVAYKGSFLDILGFKEVKEVGGHRFVCMWSLMR